MTEREWPLAIFRTQSIIFYPHIAVFSCFGLSLKNLNEVHENTDFHSPNEQKYVHIWCKYFLESPVILSPSIIFKAIATYTLF